MASGRTAAVQLPAGLTSAEAAARLKQYGLNRVEEEHRRPVLAFLSKFWAPVPWMLEATVILEILVHKRDEAIIISVLLLVNAILFPSCKKIRRIAPCSFCAAG